MVPIDIEEKNLKRRLEELEKKYNESLFKESEIPLPEEPEVPSYEVPKIFKQPKQEIRPVEITQGAPEKIIEKPKFVQQPRFTQEQRFIEKPKFVESADNINEKIIKSLGGKNIHDNL